MKGFYLTIAALLSIFVLSTTVKAEELLDADRIISAMEDNYNGYTYKNVHKLDSFIAALGDQYTPERYQAIMDPARFTGLLNEKHAEQAFATWLFSERN
ncbi:MAG TPA: hypothetical protein DDW94_09730 [Deltaproteobacteria bacterium]|nr:MAG: hypothetical protein A2Z79_12330 [Deltaproteobacteria bacterium GWA2_55_82]OGQ63957.1 MAG: hypothetical protein A3I81_07860 [Deltaproteobacteria bacterium RIFCSPLOWO2_02_FULL_55_12]OIJ73390.1 MAG: hypothetical protein A2V21_303400 [Deltaproteobacteria bacterium GWC2_55_46]HBG47251.1 hypothetical protein [Deltaproteobacteria bacterium]HCY10017.1 hypothetical protein [Deltaproteobacteria bacterium]